MPKTNMKPQSNEVVNGGARICNDMVNILGINQLIDGTLLLYQCKADTYQQCHLRAKLLSDSLQNIFPSSACM